MEQVERYNYVFEQYDGDSFIYDSKEGERIDDLSQCAGILNKKEKEIERWFEHKKFDSQINRDLLDKIEELETRLSNCIEPKFKIRQEVWFIRGGSNKRIDKGSVYGFVNDKCIRLKRSGKHLTRELINVFATEAEAKAKLEEMKNE